MRAENRAFKETTFMSIADSHIHTRFSPDSTQNLAELALRAHRTGFKYIAFTEHLDSIDAINEFDFEDYFKQISAARAAFSGLTIAAGLELGYKAETADAFKKLTDKYPFDTVINSIHELNGRDCFFADTFAGKEKNKIYGDYFDAVLKSLDAPYYFSTVGHMTYISRNAPYLDSVPHYFEFETVLDKILDKIILKEKILEANSSVYNAAGVSLPTEEIFVRYYEKGGRLVSFGSDSHQVESLGRNYTAVREMLLRIGFKKTAVCIDRKIFMLDL